MKSMYSICSVGWINGVEHGAMSMDSDLFQMHVRVGFLLLLLNICIF